MRTLCPGLLSVAMFLLMLGCLGGVSGCDGKPADGTMVAGAGPQSEAQKAMHRKAYARPRRDKARKAGRR